MFLKLREFVCEKMVSHPVLVVSKTSFRPELWTSAVPSLQSLDFICFKPNVFFSLSLSLSLHPSLLQSLDELDDDDPGEKERREEEEELVQANTFQNEAMTVDPTTGHLLLVRQPSNVFLF